MKASASLSDWLARRSRRERRVLAAGAVAAGAILLLGIGVLPALRRWNDHRESIAITGERVRRLEALLAREAELKRALESERRAERGGRLLAGITPAVAASNVQALVQRYAVESGVQLERVDVVGDPQPEEGGLSTIPVQMSGQGDIHGLVALLERVQYGEKLLIVDDLTVGSGATRPDGVRVLTFAVRMRGAWAAPAESGT